MAHGEKRPIGRVLVALGLTLALGSVALTAGASTGSTNRARTTVSAARFHDAMRRLWEEHVVWTRLFIVSFAADLPDLPATTARLLQNQVDIGDAIKPFYGKAAGDKLTRLLKQHILTAAAVLTDAKAGDQTQLKTDLDAWYANARQIARFLHHLNPANWPLADLRSMMREHLNLTLTEATDRLGAHYRKDIADFGKIEHEILQMADALSGGIEAQFPGDFR